MPQRRFALIGSVALLLAAGLVPAASAESAAATVQHPAGLLQRVTGNRLTVGLRWSRWSLDDSRRYGPDGLDNRSGSSINFLGSIWGLDPVSLALPLPYLEYRVWKVAGLGAAFDETRVKTLDWGNEEKTLISGDGDLRLRGFQAYAFARLPNGTRFTPSVRAGYARYGSSFFESPGWAMPGRDFEVQDTRGWLLAAGLHCRVWRQASLEASFEHLGLSDVEGKARLGGGSHKKGAFPVHGDVLRAGVSYAF